MADNLTKDQRSHAMSRIRSKGNVSTEQKMISLFKQYNITGWRRNVALPGKPDFVFNKEKVAVARVGAITGKLF